MNRILILNGNSLERKITGEILTSGLRTAETLLAGAPEQALQILRCGSVDLFVADVPCFDLIYCNMIATAREMAPDMPILVTSVGKQKDVSGHVWRLGVQDFLLKPYRPSWLLAAVNVLICTSGEGAGSREERQRDRYLERVAEHMRSIQYKKCMDVTKEYLDSLYDGADNVNVIRNGAVAFAEGLAKLGEPLGTAVQWKLSGCLAHFRARFDLQGRKYDTYATYEKLLNMVFDAMEEDKHYIADDTQKILNYIDRNIKQGISLDKAAEYVNMNSCYFSKFFKKVTGKNFIAYVTDFKIEAAKQMLLDTDMPVINIAYELSYSETNYFSKAFKKKVGITPSEYRLRGPADMTWERLG